MFKVLPDINHVIIVCGKSDLRRGISGLAAIVSLWYGIDPLTPETLFSSAGQDAGFYLIYIRLSNGNFQWPRNSDEARDISPSPYNRIYLL